MALHELGLDFDTHVIDIRKGESLQHTAMLCRINPHTRIAQNACQNAAVHHVAVHHVMSCIVHHSATKACRTSAMLLLQCIL